MYSQQKITSQFPFLQYHTYLNTPAYGLLSDELMIWRQEHDLDHLVGGSGFKEDFYNTVEILRDTISGFVKASREEVFLVPNFSFGWKVLTGGMPKDLHVLLLDGDYPSLNWPVVTAGFRQLGQVRVSPDMEEAVEAYFSAHQPEVFVFSVVQYLNGLRIDPDFVKRLKASYPETLFMADATQYMGTEVFSFENSGIDVVGCSGYKWLLAGTGNGFFIVRKEIQDLFYRSSQHWEPRKEPWLKGNSHLQNHLEPGHLDSLSMGSLLKAILLLQESGMERITQRLQEINTYARSQLYDHGYIDRAIFHRSSHGPFFSVEVSKKQLEGLRQRKIVFAVRGGRLRVGFHFYNQTADADKLIRVLNDNRTS